MSLSTIPFSELENYNDSNSIIAMALKIEPNDVDTFVSFWNESGIAPAGKNVIGIYRILDNVLGDEGRTDWMVEFDSPEVNFNFMKRLMYGQWVKWTSDFIDNYSSDFND